MGCISNICEIVMTENKETLIDVNDFVLCPNGELGIIQCFLSDELAQVKNSFGVKSFKTENLVKLKNIFKEDEQSNPYFRDELNPDLFEDMRLIPEVKESILNIVNEFVKEIEDEEFKLPIVDIEIVGSNASYNYTELSDVDVHIVADIEKIETAKTNDFFVKSYFDAKRKIFFQQHDIRIKGHPIELYIEDSRTPGVYNGVYSVLNNRWVQVPSKEKVQINTTVVQNKFDKYHVEISSLINEPGHIKEALKVYKHLFDMRKSGLKNGGEFSSENIVFKKLRDAGLIDRLRDYMYKERDKELSLESAEQVIKEIFVV